jgi:hypothetical protein
MKKNLFTLISLGVVVLTACIMAGCATMPGGVAPSSTPLEGRSYQIMGYTEATDSRVCLFGILPITPHNSIREAIRAAARKVGGDALIEVSVEGYTQYWILFSRNVTRVEGIGIRFTK